jgi:hypothetical protein
MMPASHDIAVDHMAPLLQLAATATCGSFTCPTDFDLGIVSPSTDCGSSGCTAEKCCASMLDPILGEAQGIG